MMRIGQTFADLNHQERAGLVTFITAGDPDYQTSLAILHALPEAGADIIELGMPFSDPMADGPSIQAASLRALKAGMNLHKVLDMVRAFRQQNTKVPIILMGYYNPIYSYGPKKFAHDAKSAGVDGLIIVDLPPEEDEELCKPAIAAELNFIRLATPTTDTKRLPAVLSNTSGFIYYVSVTGITGTKAGQTGDIEAAIKNIRQYSSLPVAVGFGIKTPEQAAKIAKIADAAVVGSVLVEKIAFDPKNAVASICSLVKDLATAVKAARK